MYGAPTPLGICTCHTCNCSREICQECGRVPCDVCGEIEGDCTCDDDPTYLPTSADIDDPWKGYP